MARDQTAAPAQEVKPEQKPTEYLVVTDRNITPQECSINGKGYSFTKGQQKRVPEQVMLILKEAGYLAHYAPAL